MISSQAMLMPQIKDVDYYSFGHEYAILVRMRITIPLNLEPGLVVQITRISNPLITSNTGPQARQAMCAIILPRPSV
jgi:hypothetical protein